MIVVPPQLDAVLERNARLAARLRHVAATAHTASGHPGGPWYRCPDPRCVITRELLDGAEAPLRAATA